MGYCYLMLWDIATLTSNKGKTEVEAKRKDNYRGKEAKRQRQRKVSHRQEKKKSSKYRNIDKRIKKTEQLDKEGKTKT